MCTRVLGAFWLVTFALSVASAAQEGPVFEAGSRTDLRCRVVEVRSIEKKPGKQYSLGAILTIEVKNGGKLAAEPVVFRVTAKKTVNGHNPGPLTVRRFAGAVFGRAGRAIRPGRALRYLVAVPLYLKGKGGLTAEVTHASFFTGAGVDTLSIRPRARKSFSFNVGNLRVPGTTYRLENPLPHPVDLCFQAVFDDPFDGRGLVRRRLPPNGTVEWEIKGLRLAGGGGVEGADIKSMKLVDWSVVKDDGAVTARQALVRALQRWRRWPETGIGVRGRYACLVQQKVNASTSGVPAFRHEGRGAFLIDAGGRVKLEPVGVLSEDSAKPLRKAIQEAFGEMKRKAPAEVAKSGGFALHDLGKTTRVMVSRPVAKSIGNGFSESTPINIEGDRITGTGEAGGASHARWQVRTLGDGWVVTARDQFQKAFGKEPWRQQRFTWTEADGLVVPATYRVRRVFRGMSDLDVRVQFSDLQRADAGAAAVGPPRGSGVTAMRAAWRASYRHPAEPVTLTGKFAFEDRGRTESLWEGKRKLSGTFTITGYRGARYDRGEVKVKEEMPRDQAARLGEVVMDRFRIWFFRDFAARRPFVAVFAGAVITPRAGKSGVFDIAGGRYRAVEVKGGRIHALVYPSGVRRVFKYKKIGEAFVPVEIETGSERCTAKWVKTGGRLVPGSMHFEKVFGDDWGPETLTISGLSARR